MKTADYFIGVVTEDGKKLLLDYPHVFKAFYRRFKGREVVLWLEDKATAKTRLQEKGFHAMVRPWADARGDRIDDLKRSLLAEVFGTMTVKHPLTGEPVEVLVEPHTSDLDKQQYSLLIEQTLVIAAERGYVLEAPSEYTARKKAEARKAARARHDEEYAT